MIFFSAVQEDLDRLLAGNNLQGRVWVRSWLFGPPLLVGVVSYPFLCFYCFCFECAFASFEVVSDAGHDAVDGEPEDDGAINNDKKLQVGHVIVYSYEGGYSDWKFKYNGEKEVCHSTVREDAIPDKEAGCRMVHDDAEATDDDEQDGEGVGNLGADEQEAGGGEDGAEAQT